jgi:MoaA/NifB/PqqE/SkfB family radical SAM enzyme
MQELMRKAKKTFFALKEKGPWFTYNLWWLSTFYSYSDNFLRNLLYLKIYPLLNWFPQPTSIEIEASTKCNLKCVMCEHTYWNEPPQDMSFEKIKSIVDQFPVLRWIAFTGIGEIFLNKDLLKTYRYLTKKWPGIHIELFDNFYFIDEEKAKELLDLGLGTIFISFNAATKETYEKVMVGSDFSRVVVNIKRFIELKKERRAYFPEVIFHYVINKINLSETITFIDLVKSLGGETIFFTRLLHSFKEVNDLTVDVSPDLSRQVQEKAKKAGIYITWNADTCVNKTPLSHCNAWITPFVYVSGDVVPCCAMNEGNIRDFQKLNSLGNVFQQSFKEIWYGKKFSDLRNQMQVGMIPLLCRDCPMFDLAAIK